MGNIVIWTCGCVEPWLSEPPAVCDDCGQSTERVDVSALKAEVERLREIVYVCDSCDRVWRHLPDADRCPLCEDYNVRAVNITELEAKAFILDRLLSAIDAATSEASVARAKAEGGE